MRSQAFVDAIQAGSETREYSYNEEERCGVEKVVQTQPADGAERHPSDQV